MTYQKRGKSYRTQIRLNGERVSVTAPTVAELKREVSKMRLKTHRNASKIDFKTAMDNLLMYKSNVLSANTTASYKAMGRQLAPLYDKRVSDLTMMDVQAFINSYAANHSPKSCSNLLSYIMVVIKSVTDVEWKVKLPQKNRPVLDYPTEEEMRTIIENADEKLRKGILICAFAPARRGEACALKYSDIDDDTIHIHATIAMDEGYIYKDTTKTPAGDRVVVMPREVMEQLGNGDPEEYVVGLTPLALYDRWRRLLKKLGMKPYRLHSTRVFGASFLHKVGMPDAYIMKRGGWSSASCMQNIYRKSLTEDTEAVKIIGDFLTPSWHH